MPPNSTDEDFGTYTATSWRRTRISTFLAAVLLASSPSQPNSLIVIRYSSRNNTAHDHVMIT
jgi:hypothetical protein